MIPPDRERLIDRLAAELTGALRERPGYEVVTRVRVAMVDGFPNLLTRFDVAVVGSESDCGITESAAIAARREPWFGLNIVTAETLKHDLIDTPNIIPLCALGEFVVADPSGDVLRPRLQAFQSSDTGTQSTDTAATGVFTSWVGFRVELADGVLRVRGTCRPRRIVPCEDETE